MTLDPFSTLYVVRCKNGEPCLHDRSNGAPSSCYNPAGRPTWSIRNAELAMQWLDAKTPQEAGAKVSQEEWDRLFKAVCGPHFISEYWIQKAGNLSLNGKALPGHLAKHLPVGGLPVEGALEQDHEDQV